MSHCCPFTIPAKGRCPVICPDTRLMCPPHWRMVPKPFQAAVWAAYERHGVGSAALRAAHRAAIDSVDNQLADGAPQSAQQEPR